MANEKRLIDAYALSESIQGIGKNINRPRAVELAVLVEIAEQPTVDAVEVVHGRWEWLGPNRLVPECMCGTCSNCKVRTKYIVNTEICPNCGAKMDGKPKDKEEE